MWAAEDANSAYWRSPIDCSAKWVVGCRAARVEASGRLEIAGGLEGPRAAEGQGKVR